MRIPSRRRTSFPGKEGNDELASLEKRKGGGGGGRSSSSGRGRITGSTHGSGSNHGTTTGKGGKGGSSSGKGSSNASKHGASDKFTSSNGAKSFSLPGTKSSASAYSDGGGKPTTLGSSSPFSGRLSGGGTRGDVYGTSQFGSGYSYGGYGTYVNERPLPYGFYPNTPQHGYYGGDEYIVNGTTRPGGPSVVAIIQPSWNQSSVTYRISGDNSSVHAVLDALTANCSVIDTSSTVAIYSPGTSWPLPEQVVQYYRASSFMLSLDSYNNTAALLSKAPSSNSSVYSAMAPTPLPSGLNSTFLTCVNMTIGASIPLMDPPSKKTLSSGEKFGIAFGAIAGLYILWHLIKCFWRHLGRLDDRRAQRRANFKTAKKQEEERAKKDLEAKSFGNIEVVDTDGNIVINKPEKAFEAGKEKEGGRELDTKRLLDASGSPSSSRASSPAPPPMYSPTYSPRPSFEERTLAGEGASTLSRSTTRKWGSRSPSPSPTSSRFSEDARTLLGEGASIKSSGSSFKGKGRYLHVSEDSGSQSEAILLIPTPVGGHESVQEGNRSSLDLPGRFH